MAPLPGTPKAMVGIRSPPSLELFAAPGPKHAAHIALAEIRSGLLQSFALCTACA